VQSLPAIFRESAILEREEKGKKEIPARLPYIQIEVGKSNRGKTRLDKTGHQQYPN
jgi:hypothetical protein